MEPVSLTTLSAPRSALLRQAEPVRIASVRKGSFVEQRIAIKETLGKVRGWRPAANRKAVPKATVGDVLDVAEAWTKAGRRFGKKSSDKSTWPRWNRFVRESVRPALKLGREAEFPAKLNEQFWQQELARIAIWLDGMSGVVPEWKILVSSIKEAWEEAPKRVADTVVELGEAAGAAVAAPVKGLADAFGITPRNILFGLALVGAGVVLVRRASK